MGNINYHLPEHSKAIQIPIEMNDIQLDKPIYSLFSRIASMSLSEKFDYIATKPMEYKR